MKYTGGWAALGESTERLGVFLANRVAISFVRGRPDVGIEQMTSVVRGWGWGTGCEAAALPWGMGEGGGGLGGLSGVGAIHPAISHLGE